MLTWVRTAGLSLPRLTGALCGALAVALGFVVLAGWAFHFLFLVQIAPNLAPMQRTTAVSFAASGIALMAIVMHRPRVTLIFSGIAGTLGAASLFEYLFRVNLGIDTLLGIPYVVTQTIEPGRMAHITAFCFVTLSTALVLAQTDLLKGRSPILGIAGLIVAAVGATCGIGMLSGTGDAHTWTDLNRVAFHTAGGFILLGAGATAVDHGHQRRDRRALVKQSCACVRLS